MGTQFLHNNVATLQVKTKENPSFCLSLSLVIFTIHNFAFLLSGKLQKKKKIIIITKYKHNSNTNISTNKYDVLWYNNLCLSAVLIDVAETHRATCDTWY